MELEFILHAIGSHIPGSSTIAAFAGAGSAIAAVWTIRKTASERENERLLESAITTLERAYMALAGHNDRNTLPPADRVAWLASARLIEDYKEAKKRLKDPLIAKECEAHEEHWRHQFYLQLQPLSGGRSSYYYRSDEEEPIEKTSAIIVHAFASWPEEKIDPLKRYLSPEDAEQKLKVSQKWQGLKLYLEARG